MLETSVYEIVQPSFHGHIPDTFILFFSFSLVNDVIELTLTQVSLGALSTFTLYLLYAALTATTVALELHFVATPFL